MNSSAVIKRDDELTVVPSTSTTKTTKKTTRRRRKTRSLFDKFNDDVLIEILIKLSIECLHRYKSVCKHWHTLISEPSFVHRYIQLRPNYFSHHNHFIIQPTSSTRHFVLQIYDELDEFTSIHNKLDFSFKFLPIFSTKNFLPTVFKTLATSHGLLLCKAKYTNKYYNCFVVCNPLTKKWLNVPPLQYRYCDFGERPGFMCYPLNPLDYQILFTIIVVQYKYDVDNQDYFNTHVFSSDTDRWASHVVACQLGLQWSWHHTNIFVCNGMFHWFTDSGIVAYDPLIQPQNCKLISLPSPVSNGPSTTVFGVSEGHIRLCISSPNYDFLDIWELEDYEKELWCLKYHIQRQSYCRNWMFSPSNSEMLYCIKCRITKLMMMICNMKVGSIIAEKPFNTSDVQTLIPFVMTPWPTPIPQLPYKGSSYNYNWN